VVAPESRLPRNSVVVFPHPSFNIPASFVLLLEKEELEREGVIGKVRRSKERSDKLSPQRF